MAINMDERRTTTTPRAGTPNQNRGADMWPRAVNIVVGAWLFVSAFLWPHSSASQTNTWVVGLLAVGFAVWGLWFPAARFLNTALSLWLAFSTIIIFHLTAATLWNNLIVAAVIFFISLIPSHSTTTPHRRGRYVEA